MQVAAISAAESSRWGTSMERQCFILDPTGSDLHGEAAQLREQGPAIRVTLPGGIPAWSVNRYDVAKRVLTDPRVTKSARHHWLAYVNGEIPPDWEMISWVAMDNMVTAYGKDHLRLRRLVGKAFSTRRTEAVRPRVERLTGELLDALEATADQVRSWTCGRVSPTRCRHVWSPT
jgi:cytochrome P450